MSKLNKRKSVNTKNSKASRKVKNTNNNIQKSKNYVVDEEKVNIKLGNNKILASDPYIKGDIVLTSFFGEDSIDTPPNQIDIFLRNTSLLAEKEDDIVPWIPYPSEQDSFISEAIQSASTITEFSDSISDSDIIELGE